MMWHQTGGGDAICPAWKMALLIGQRRRRCHSLGVCVGHGSSIHQTREAVV